MPILAGTMVIPELIPVTYAKVRAELARELSGSPAATILVLARDGSGILTRSDGSLPVATAANGEPVWRAVLREAENLGAKRPQLVGWAGINQTEEGQSVLVVQGDLGTAESHRHLSGEELEATDLAPVVAAGRRLVEY
jgi:ATP adenylyltransferase